MARSLAKVRRWKRVHFSWDSLSYESGVLRGIAALKAGGFPLYAATFYVLIGFGTTPEQDAYRIDTLDRLGVPILTCSASVRKCELQGVSSLKVLQMPMTGRPSNWSCGTPLPLTHGVRSISLIPFLNHS